MHQTSPLPFSLWAPISPSPIQHQGSFGTDRRLWRCFLVLALSGAHQAEGPLSLHQRSCLTSRDSMARDTAGDTARAKRRVGGRACALLGAELWLRRAVAASTASARYRRFAALRWISSPTIQGIYLSHFHVPLRKHHFLSHFCRFLSSQRVFNEMRKRLFLQAGVAWVISI